MPLKTFAKKTLNEIHKLYVRPQLDYGGVIYHLPQIDSEFSDRISLKNQMQKLESVQYSAALAVTGVWKGTSRDKIYNELDWEFLNKRRWSRRLVLFYKIINNLTPEYTKTPIPPPREISHGLRKMPTIGHINARTDDFQSSFYPFCLIEWEKLFSDIRISCSVSIFKNRLLSIIRPPE